MADGLSRVQQIGQALGGFGAGIQGNLPQFQAAQNQRRQLEAQEAERQRVAQIARQKQIGEFTARASRQALRLIEAGEFGQAIDLSRRVIRQFAENGIDTTDVQRVAAMITAAGNGSVEAKEHVIGELENQVSLGRVFGHIETDELIPVGATQRLVTRGGEVVVDVAEEREETPVTPAALLVGLDDDTKNRASAAFEAAGGGSAGVSALNAQVSLGAEAQLRGDVPSILSSSFPNASPAEMEQLKAAVKGASSVESGMSIAGDIRTEQRRLTKAKGFQERAVSLLENIVSNDQLGDVTGSLEGRYDIRIWSQEESDLIADINEAQDILTADNMDLMTGVLSESDIQLLKNLASGALNRTRGRRRFQKDAQQLLDKLSSQLVETVDDLSADEDKEGDIGINPQTGETIVFRNGQWVAQ